MIPLRKYPEPHLKIVHRNEEQEQASESLVARKQDQRRKGSALATLNFSIGLFVSLLLLIVVFEWKTYDNEQLVEVPHTHYDRDEMLEIPLTRQPPPPPVKVVQQPNIIEVKEEKIIEELKVDFDIEITNEETIEQQEIVTDLPVDEPTEEVAEEIFTIVEEKPEPVGGMTEFMKYISKNIKYPETAERLNIQGRVFVQFVVNTNGELTDLVVVKGIGGGCDEEALRVLAAAAPWSPGKQRGKPVKVRQVIPILFVLKQR